MGNPHSSLRPPLHKHGKAPRRVAFVSTREWQAYRLVDTQVVNIGRAGLTPIDAHYLSTPKQAPT